MDRRSTLAFFILLGVALASYVVLAFFVHPFADDFSYAVAGMHNPLLKRLADEYQLWNGRWFSNILVLRGPLVLGMEKGLVLYRIVPITLLALTGCGVYSLIRWLGDGGPRRNAILGALAFLVLYLHLMPDLSEGVYWYTGAVSYLLPGALLFPFVAATVRMSGTLLRYKPLVLALHVVLIFIIAGCSELHMVYMVLFHVVVVFVRLRSRKRIDPMWITGSIAACVAAYIMITAPGNAGRAVQFPMRADVLHTLLRSTLQTGRFLLTWVASPALLVLSVLYIAYISRSAGKLRLLVHTLYLHPALVALVIVAVVFISMALPYWGTGSLGQHRTVNATLLVFLPLWFWMLTNTVLLFMMKGYRLPVLTPRMQLICWALLGITLFGTGNGGRVTRDLFSGSLQHFDRQLHARYDTLRRASLEEPRVLRVDPVLPLRSLRYLDGTRDPGHWVNRSIMQYFDADATALMIEPAVPAITTPPAPR